MTEIGKLKYGLSTIVTAPDLWGPQTHQTDHFLFLAGTCLLIISCTDNNAIRPITQLILGNAFS